MFSHINKALGLRLSETIWLMSNDKFILSPPLKLFSPIEETEEKEQTEEEERMRETP